MPSLLLLLALAAPPLSLPGVRYPTPTGDVWVEMAAAGKDGPREGVARGVIEAPPERVFRALTDYGHWPEFMPFLLASDACPQPDGSVVARQVMKPPAPAGERRYRVRFRQRVETGPSGRTWKIDWAYVPGSGNIAGLHGSWVLTALGPGRALGVLHLYTDPGGLTPHWAVDRGTAETIPWIFHGLRQQVRRSRYDGP
ncbi:MAG TPA: SRPBCC family protein [Thermoanaerobaculia bacterium]|nr:SRPBCC family protein [Thermoanaerobaculia bacterium]